MREMFFRLLRTATLAPWHCDQKLRATNAALAHYGLQLEQLDCSHATCGGVRPIDMLSSIGSATVTALGQRQGGWTLRLAHHWGIVKYIADLGILDQQYPPPAMALTPAGQRYRGTARGAFSGDIGVGWSHLAITTCLGRDVPFLDIDHAGANYVNRVNGNPGENGRRPDFVCLSVGGHKSSTSISIDLIEAKGRKQELQPPALARAALQTMSHAPAGGRRLRGRLVTTIHGTEMLEVGMFRVSEVWPFRPRGDYTREEADRIRSTFQDTEFGSGIEGHYSDIIGDEADATEGIDSPVAGKALRASLNFIGGRRMPGPDEVSGSAWRSKWTSENLPREEEGLEFEGVETVTGPSGGRLRIREGILSSTLDALEATYDSNVVSRLQEHDSELLTFLRRADADTDAGKSRRFVRSTDSSVTAVDRWGLGLEVELLEG